MERNYVVGQMAYFNFACDDATGNAANADSATYAVRKCGAGAGNSPALTGAAARLTTGYGNGAYEIGFNTTNLAAGEYAVFLLVAIGADTLQYQAGSFMLYPSGTSIAPPEGNLAKLDIVNKALGKIGGAGDAINGDAMLTNLTGTDKVTKWVLASYDSIRQRVITDLVVAKCPFRETVKYAELTETAEADRPAAMGGWRYCFDLPDDYFCMIGQRDESDRTKEYQFEVVVNNDGDGLLLLTNDLSNAARDSAYIQYAIDQESEAIWSLPFIECVTVLLASEICPVIGRDMKTAAALLGQYEQLTKLRAKQFNQGQSNNHSKQIPNYLGGRS